MLKKILLPVILLILAYGFWISPEFKAIAAGVAIFLFGMLFLQEGFKAFTGGLLERLLQQSTDTTWKSLGFGILSTTLMQSSSLVSVITISFLSAGLITLTAGIGIIFGANLGTTTGAWLVAAFGLKVDIAAYAMPMLVFGVVLSFQKSRYLKGAGHILAGLGFLFLGIHYMKEGFETFRGNFDLAALAVPGYRGLFLFAAVGVAATVVMQSSHATLVLILTALAAQQITYENALALAIGANVGTTITAIIGAFSANIEGKRLAAAHLLFNLLTGVIAIALIQQLVAGVEAISDAMGIAPDNYTLKLAVFHTLFNLAGVILLLPFINPMAVWLTRLLPAPRSDIVQPLYLNDAVIDFPETVLAAVRREVWHLFDSAFEIMAHGLNLHRNQITGSNDLYTTIHQDREVIDFDLDESYERKVKVLYGAIIEFISRAQSHMPSPFADELFRLRQSAADIVEAVKHIKHLRKNTSLYMVSRNVPICAEYNQLRLKIARILRDIQAFRTAPEDSISLLELDSLKVEVEQDRQSIHQHIDELIRHQRITPLMATSLLNDFTYSDEVAHHLIDAARNLLILQREPEMEAAQEIMLDEDEITEVAKEQT
ncbi:MAG: Na/Pi cotransporter family protein [Thiothrix sp.]|nr:Na/Pi cotransporter family protein [Thiothrix sp.]HPE60896.1 Na/Pi symporter [Thiolinea sp.]